MSEINALGQPVGAPFAGTLPALRPEHAEMSGRYTTLVPLRESHAEALFEAFAEDTEGRGWTYLPIDPWSDVTEARVWCKAQQASTDPMFFVILDAANVVSGVCTYLRIAPEAGSIEVGYFHFAPRIQRSRVATEAMFLMLATAFDTLGYRRYEWKCDALNAPSRAAAQRFGFTFEGIFRQATVVKGRNRDTAWFSITDGEWPALKAGYAAWLLPDNFDAEGRQKARLQDLVAG